MAYTTTYNGATTGSLFDVIAAFFASVSVAMQRNTCVEQFSL